MILRRRLLLLRAAIDAIDMSAARCSMRYADIERPLAAICYAVAFEAILRDVKMAAAPCWRAICCRYTPIVFLPAALLRQMPRDIMLLRARFYVHMLLCRCLMRYADITRARCAYTRRCRMMRRHVALRCLLRRARHEEI